MHNFAPIVMSRETRTDRSLAMQHSSCRNNLPLGLLTDSCAFKDLEQIIFGNNAIIDRVADLLHMVYEHPFHVVKISLFGAGQATFHFDTHHVRYAEYNEMNRFSEEVQWSDLVKIPAQFAW